MGDLRAGRYALILADVRPLGRPFPWKGMMGLWDGRACAAASPEIAALAGLGRAAGPFVAAEGVAGGANPP